MQPNSEHKYDDIIDMPHHVSETHPQMSVHDRAAQFSPFAALTGYDDAVTETARLTECRVELDEDAVSLINRRLRILIDNAGERPLISVTYFVPDERKSGGAYVTVSGNFRRFDESDISIVLSDGAKISVSDIYFIEGDIFEHWENEFDA